MKTQVHKVVVQVIDFDGLGADGVIEAIEETHYPNRCIAPRVRDIQTREVEWDDDHPLNKRNTAEATFRLLFE